jgi:hypothetical protein
MMAALQAEERLEHSTAAAAAAAAAQATASGHIQWEMNVILHRCMYIDYLLLT